MKVLSLIDDVMSLGGVEAFQYDLAAELGNLGIDFQVLNLKPSDDGNRRIPKWASDFRRSRWLRGPLAVAQARRAIQKTSADLFLVHQPSSLSFLMNTLPECGTKTISVVHNNSPREQYWNNELRWQKEIQGYVAVSNTIRNRLVNEYGVDSTRVWIVPCGVTTAVRTFSGNRRRSLKQSGRLKLLYVGRLATYAKQVLDLVRLVSELNSINSAHRLHISLDVVGDGPEAETLKQQLQMESGRIEINWHGRMERQELYKLYEQMHCILLFSSSEGMPIALREAMSRGVVPVVTDIEAHREILCDRTNGFLFPVNRPDQCAKVLMDLVGSSDFETMSRKASASVAAHSVEITAKKYAQVFETVLRKGFRTSGRELVASAAQQHIQT